MNPDLPEPGPGLRPDPDPDPFHAAAAAAAADPAVLPRRRLGQALLAAGALAAVGHPAALATAGAASAPGAATGRKVLRLAFVKPETSFDPARVVDIYSRNVTAHIFEGLYTYDPLARPARIVPLTAAGMPEASADFRVFTVRIQPGIFFADDPAFGGRPRELVAADYVYAFKRFADPALKSPTVGSMLDLEIRGLRALREAALKAGLGARFDYDTPIEGLQAPERHTLRFVLDKPRPRFIEDLAVSDLLGAVAREVVQAYGDKVDAHPVGTGPFRLTRWRRSSEIVLERNPGYRARHFEGQPAADDAEGQAILAQLQGRRLPIVDEVRIAIIEESQPMWLAFLNAQVDGLVTQAGRMPPEFIPQALPEGRVAPNLARRGVRGRRTLNPDMGVAMFNMDDPVLGGYTPERVALRRAIALGYDNRAEIEQIRRGGIPAQSPVVPHTSGYVPGFKSEMGDHDPARARALLDLYGYLDRDGDGWREQPDGRPLVVTMATQPDQLTRKFDELWRKNMRAIGIRFEFKAANWPENLKAARAGKLQFWELGRSASAPDGLQMLTQFYGPQTGAANTSRFRLPAFDALYEQLQAMPDGPERERLFEQAKRLVTAYMPSKITCHRSDADVWHPWLLGYRRPLFWLDWWHQVDLDPAARAAALTA